MKFAVIAVKERKQLPQGGLDQNPPDDFTIPFHLQKSPLITTKRVKIPLNNHFSVVDL